MLILPSLLGITEIGSLSAVLILFCALSAFFFPRFFRKKMADRNNRRFSHILVLLLLIMTAAFRISSVQADNIILGSGAIIKDNKVYFGNINGNPVLWRVMGPGNNDTGNKGMLLLSEYLLDSKPFYQNETDGNAWQGSVAQSWCRNFYNGFTSSEKSSIIQTTKNDRRYGSFGGSTLSNERMFFLSALEAAETYFQDNERRKAYYWDDPNEVYSRWWLRSPFNQNSAGIVEKDGSLQIRGVRYFIGTRPAFNLDPASVLLSTKILSDQSDQYKLTLRDLNLVISVTSGAEVTRDGSTVTIPYTISGTNSETGTKSYVMVTDLAYTDNNAKVLYYDDLTAGGTGTLTLDSGWGKNYKVYLLAVNEGGEKKTDTASRPVEIPIPKVDQTVNPPTALPDLKYTGEPVTLINAGTAVNGTMKYAVTEENAKPSAEAYTYTDDSLPTGTGAKTYFVWYMSIGNTGYNDYVGTTPVIVTIDRADQTVNPPTALPGLKYTGEPVTLINAGTAVNGTMKYAVTDENAKPSAEAYTCTDDSLPAGTGAKTYYVWYMSAGKEGYKDYVGTDPVIVTIAAADPETPTGLTAVYGRKLADVELPDGWVWADSSESVGDTGPKTFKANYISSDKNYNSLTDVEVSVSVTPKPLSDSSVTIDVLPEISFPYTGNEYTVTVEVYDGDALLTEGVDYEIKEGSVLNEAAAGTYTITVSADDKGVSEAAQTTKAVSGMNYTGEKSVTWEITPSDEPEPDHHQRIDFFRLCEDCTLPATGFSAARPTVLSEQPKDLRYGHVRMRLMIPTLDQDIELVTVPQQENSWAVDWLGSDAGILEGSTLPGEGLSVVAAHNALNDTEFGPFALLATLEVNDLIAAADDEGSLKLFRVYANELLEPGDMAALAAVAGQEENPLVLVTCENESLDGGYLNRRVIFAKQVL